MRAKQFAAEVWQAAGLSIPRYDRAAMRARTLDSPAWLHIGAGNIFRAFIVAAADDLLNAGLCQTGVIVCDLFDAELIDRAYRAADDLSVLCTLRADGQIDSRLIAAVALSLCARDMRCLTDILAAPSLQMVSLTITEKGYRVTQSDIDASPQSPAGTLSALTAGLYARFCAGGRPLALVSMDNCAGNGDVLRASVRQIAVAWAERGAVERGFVRYVESERVAFPLTMIDKITPRPDAAVALRLSAAGVPGTDIFVTGGGTHASVFVNAEEAQYLVIEDAFPNGRPPLENAPGVYLTNRETVLLAERMKVSACLNPLHTALAVLGCQLGYMRISDEMRDDDLRALVCRLAFDEGIPVTDDPRIFSPRDFAVEVLTRRLPNPFIPDTPQRIATDTSQKLPVRFGQTLKAYARRGGAPQVVGIPFVLAAWLRYLTGIDDRGAPFALSPDPLLAQLQPIAQSLLTGDVAPARALLAREDLFGLDLNALPQRDGRSMADAVMAYLGHILPCHAPGALRRALHSLAEGFAIGQLGHLM